MQISFLKVLLLTSVVSLSAFAQAKHHGSDHAMPPAPNFEQLASDLKLSDKKKAKFIAIMQAEYDAKQAHKKVHQQHKKQRKAAKEKHKKQLKNLLDKKQLKALKAKRAEQDTRHHKHKKHKAHKKHRDGEKHKEH